MDMKELKALCEKIANNQYGSTLRLTERKIDDEQAIMLAKALEKNTSIKSIELYSNNIGEEGAIALANALKGNETLVRFGFSGNNPGLKGGIALVEAFKDNKTLITLRVGGNIGPEFGKVMVEFLKSNTTVQILSVAGNNLKWGAKVLFEALQNNKSLKEFYCAYNQLGYEDGVALTRVFQANKTLRKLYAQGNKFNIDNEKDFIKVLNENYSITSIEGISNEGLMYKAINFENRNKTILRLKQDIDLLFPDVSVEQARLVFNPSYDALLRSEHDLYGLSSKDINNLFPKIDVVDAFAASGEFNLKYFNNILEICKKLMQRGYPAKKIEELEKTAMLAYYSWDTVAVSPEQRISGLNDLLKYSQEAKLIELEQRILATLSHVYLTLSTGKTGDDQRNHCLLAYTYALHGTPNDARNHTLAMALSMWIGKGMNLDHQKLLQDLATNNKDQFLAFQEGYQPLCKQLRFTPLPLLASSSTETKQTVEQGKLLEERKTVVEESSETAKQGMVLQFEESKRDTSGVEKQAKTDNTSGAATEALRGLDEDDDVVMLDAAIALSLKRQ